MFVEFVLVLVVAFYFYHFWASRYWERKNVFSVRESLLFGNVKDILFSRKTLIEMFAEIYVNYKSKGLIGFYSFYRPMVLVTDPNIIRCVLVKEFNSFSDNGYRIYSEADPMFGQNPFCTTGIQKWKSVRGLHAPLHTPGRLKEMFPLMKKSVKNMIEYIKEQDGHPVTVMDVTGFYTIDNVALCAYGFEPTAFSDPENGFRKHATSKLFTSSTLANLSALFFPKLAQYLKLRIVSKHAEDFFVSMVKSVVDYRENNNVSRPDLIDQLMKINKKKLDENKSGLSELEFAGHSITFYLDGYETSASELSFILLEIANHPDVQERLREEIRSAFQSLEDVQFEQINSLPYLSMTLNECLRLHPLLPVLSRECTTDVELGNTVIEKGTKVFIPVECLHYDPDFFPEPLQLRPERFSDENSIIKYTFLPFGEGPRMCLGFRFALLQLKVALVSILLHFRVLPSSGQSKQEILFDENAPFVVTPKKETTLIFKPISD